METRTTEDGLTIYVHDEEALRGSKGPFFAVYSDEGLEDRYGFLCGNCETIDNAADPMGRIQCNTCGNTKKPDEWDAVQGA